MKAVMNRARAFFGRLLRQPIGELSHAQRTLRYAVDLTRHCARQLGRNHATQMAAALTYRTIFSLVPIAVLMLLVFRAFGGFEQVSVDLQGKAYQYLGLGSISLATGDPAAEDGGEPTDNDDQLRASVDKIIGDLTAKASQANVGSVGVVGLALLIWAALALLITVERSFNQIYNCPAGRSWHLRVPVYWAAITLGPVLLFVSLYVAQALVAHVQRWMGGEQSGLFSNVAEGLSWGTALAASWLLLFLLYVLMPNTRVRLRPALAGAFVAAVLWELGKWGFKLYVAQAVSYSTLYGSLGLVPLFLLWLYLTWLIVLFGLEITYTLQLMRGRAFEKKKAVAENPYLYDPRWLVPVVVQVAEGFGQGRVVDAESLSQDLGLSTRAVAAISDKLCESQLVHRVPTGDGDHTGLVLAKPSQDITIKQLLTLAGAVDGACRGPSQGRGWALLSGLSQAQLEAAEGLTVAGLIRDGWPHAALESGGCVS